MKCVALLRGINVGKGPKVPMKRLTAVLEGLGLQNVQTYLSSGNVVFQSDLTAASLADRIGRAVEEAFGQPIPTLVMTSSEMLAIDRAIPKTWGSGDNEQTYVAYLFPAADRPEIVAELPVKHQFMNIRYIKGAFVWNIKKENYNKSQITKISSHAQYALMTTRNISTAKKLAELARE